MHLISEYTELEEEDIQEIDRKIKEPFSRETLFVEFVEQIEWNQEAVAVQNLYSPVNIISMAYANIDKCGLYQDNFRNWLRKTRSNKTWGNFKTHFDRAFKEIRRSSRNSSTKGYIAYMYDAQANA